MYEIAIDNYSHEKSGTKLSTSEKPDQNTVNSIDVVKRVIDENWRVYLWQYVLAFLLLAVVSASTVYPAWIMKNIINDVFVSQNMQAAYLIAVSIALVFTIRGFATYAYMYVLGKIANNIVARKQREVYQHLLKLGVGFYKENRSAYIVGQVNQNIMGMRLLLNDIVVLFARDALTLIGLLAAMVTLDPYMSTVTLVTLPLLVFIIRKYVRGMRQVARQEVDLNSRVTSMIVETGQGVEILKSFTAEKSFIEKMSNLTEAVETTSNRIVRLNAKTKPPTEILAGLAIALFVSFGGYRVAELGHDPGALFAFLTAAMLAYEPIRKLASFRVSFEQRITNARMLYELLDMPERQADKKNAKELIVDKGEINFQNVNFSYIKGEPVLRDVTLIAAAGKTTALVGPSGGGKSTIISLIQRFFDTGKGSITIDGQKIANATGKSLRSKIAYVSQQPMMFEGSIRDNILIGKPEASDAEVIRAAKLAQAHDFILKQPHGYETPVGELGGNLSGGQRQRISIARAFLRDAPILLLDEATSALDNKSEKLVQEALDVLMQGRTTIVVAHRLSTIRNADRIYVIDGGKIVESGTHASLAKRKSGIYANLHEIGVDG